MSRAKRRSKELGAIKALHVLARQHAEMRLLDRRRKLDAASEEGAQEEAFLSEVLQSWERQLASPAMDPLTVGSWALAVQQQSQRVAQCNATVRRAAEDNEEAHRALSRADAAQSCSTRLWRHAVKRLSRVQEERRLSRNDDDNSWSWLVP